MKRLIEFLRYDMDYNLQCWIFSLSITKYLLLAIFLGIIVDGIFALFIIGFPIAFVFWFSVFDWWHKY